MRSRKTMVTEGFGVCFCHVTTPDGRLFKFKGNYNHLSQFENKVIGYFHLNEPSIAFDIKIINLKKTNSHQELDDPSVIEI